MTGMAGSWGAAIDPAIIDMTDRAFGVDEARRLLAQRKAKMDSKKEDYIETDEFDIDPDAATEGATADVDVQETDSCSVRSQKYYRMHAALSVAKALPPDLDYAMLALEDAKRLIITLHADIDKHKREIKGPRILATA